MYIIIVYSSNLYLVDSGGQYLDGTTDVTRTFHYGTPTQEQVRYNWCHKDIPLWYTYSGWSRYSTTDFTRTFLHVTPTQEQVQYYWRHQDIPLRYTYSGAGTVLLTSPGHSTTVHLLRSRYSTNDVTRTFHYGTSTQEQVRYNWRHEDIPLRYIYSRAGQDNIGLYQNI